MSESLETPAVVDPLVARWQENVHRILRRSEISSQLGVTQNLDDLKIAVRDWEKKVDINSLITGLVSEETLVNPQMAEVAAEVFDKVSLKYPKIEAVVLMGSSVHGGGQLREVLDTAATDLDWGVIVKTELNDNTDYLYSHVPFITDIEGIVEEVAMGRGLNSEFHSCRTINPARYHSPSIESTEEAKILLENFAYNKDFEKEKNLFSADKAIVSYFQPSFPSEVNIENRKHLLNGLKALHDENEDVWGEVLYKIVSRWKEIHSIKTKHLRKEFESDPRYTLISSTAEDSGEIMSRAMKALLESTSE